MNDNEMNLFLTEIGGLKHYFSGTKIISLKGFGIGNGWYGLIKETIEKLIANGWNREILDIKEKFGGLRFYINDGNEKLFKIIENSENKSYRICEITGKKGKLRKDITWIKTLCDEEYEKITNKIKENEK